MKYNPDVIWSFLSPWDLHKFGSNPLIMISKIPANSTMYINPLWLHLSVPVVGFALLQALLHILYYSEPLVHSLLKVTGHVFIAKH